MQWQYQLKYSKYIGVVIYTRSQVCEQTYVHRAERQNMKGDAKKRPDDAKSTQLTIQPKGWVMTQQMRIKPMNTVDDGWMYKYVIVTMMVMIHC